METTKNDIRLIKILAADPCFSAQSLNHVLHLLADYKRENFSSLPKQLLDFLSGFRRDSEAPNTVGFLLLVACTGD